MEYKNEEEKKKITIPLPQGGNQDHPSEQRAFLLTWVILRIFELKMR